MHMQTNTHTHSDKYLCGFCGYNQGCQDFKDPMAKVDLISSISKVTGKIEGLGINPIKLMFVLLFGAPEYLVP